MDPITPSNVTRLRPGDTGPAKPGDAPAAGQTAPGPKVAVSAVDTVKLSDDVASAIEKLSELDPPIDASRVAIVKAAILEGSYPLDSQRVADSFFRDAGAMLGK